MRACVYICVCGCVCVCVCVGVCVCLFVFNHATLMNGENKYCRAILFISNSVYFMRDITLQILEKTRPQKESVLFSEFVHEKLLL